MEDYFRSIWQEDFVTSINAILFSSDVLKVTVITKEQKVNGSESMVPIWVFGIYGFGLILSLALRIHHL